MEGIYRREKGRGKKRRRILEPCIAMKSNAICQLVLAKHRHRLRMLTTDRYLSDLREGSPAAEEACTRCKRAGSDIESTKLRENAAAGTLRSRSKPTRKINPEPSQCLCPSKTAQQIPRHRIRRNNLQIAKLRDHPGKQIYDFVGN